MIAFHSKTLPKAAWSLVVWNDVLLAMEIKGQLFEAAFFLLQRVAAVGAWAAIETDPSGRFVMVFNGWYVACCPQLLQDAEVAQSNCLKLSLVSEPWCVCLVEQVTDGLGAHNCPKQNYE